MSLKTNIYHGPVGGDPVDFSSAVEQVTGDTADVTDVGPGESRWYAVRIFDPVADLEEYGTAAQILLVRGPDGSDWTDRPGAPTGVRVVMGPGGTATVSWTQLPRPDRSAPTSFAVYLTTGTTVDFTADPVLTWTVLDDTQVQYSAPLVGLVDGTVYAVGVRGVRNNVDDGNTTSTVFTADSSPPAHAERLSSDAVFNE